MNRRESRDAGQDLKTASGVAANTPAELCELGFRHLQSGEMLDAQLCCQQALSIDANFADALHLMGLLSLRADQADHAVEWLARAVSEVPKPRFLVDLGHAQRKLGRLEEAFKAFDRAVELDIDLAEAWKGLAQILADLNRHQEAALSFQHVLKLDPSDADAAYQAGLLLFRSGKMEEALALLSISKELRPHHTLTLRMRSLALQNLARLDEAAAEMAGAHALDPASADICNSMGVLLRKPGRPEEALIWFDKALARRPDFQTSLNKGFALERLHRFDEALTIYAAIKAADPGNVEADWNTALVQLLRRNFETGWAGREARWKVPALPLARYDFSQPMWRGGEPIAGKTILIYQDEGLGDVIQFARYVPDVAALGARVILLVDDALVPLLSKLQGVAECVPRSVAKCLSFDTYCAITSLPLAFDTRLETIPTAMPYVPIPAESRRQTWERRLGPHDRLRVGLVWSGNPTHGDDRNRSIPLRALLPLFGLDATFVSLQKDPRPADRATLSEQTGIVDVTVHLTDFVETAALVSCLDLVITVDTSTAHLAGALACPTWILLPYTPDWRWLLDRDDSPWYPTARLFRQDEGRDYAPVIERVCRELSARIAEWRASVPAGGDRDVPLSPEVVATVVDTGFAWMRAGRLADAEAIGRSVLSLIPDHADSLHLMPLLKLHQKQFDNAVKFLSLAIRHDPKPLYLTSLGTALLSQGGHDEAVQVFDRAVRIRPDGQALIEAGRSGEAILAFEQMLKLNPRHWDAANRAALLLFRAERNEEALACFDICADMQPDHFPTIYMRALALHNLKRFKEAIDGHTSALALDPASADTCHNMGNTLRALFRPQEAIAWYDRSLALRPASPMTLGNKAVALAELRRFDEAIMVYRQAIAADPTHGVAEWNLALLQLLLGDFEAGWAGQEARWKTSSLSTGYPGFSQPKWLGVEPIAGKTVIACANEGIGDAIQFARYVPMLAARGAEVILVVHDQLCPLLSRIEGVAQCLPRSASPLPNSDFHIPLSSLPLAFGTRLDTVPADTPYLSAPPERMQAWRERLGAHDRLRVGLVWAGNPSHKNDRNRSLPLRLMTPLLDLDASFVSLQKDPRPDDRAFLSERREIVDLTADLFDFTETAALISCLDLVISVDTSVAHLAGALACPSWILLPYMPDWRWLLDRDDSPWYPTAKLFRQDETHDYGRLVERVRSELRACIATWSPGSV
jgi:tetratricopeptide (TPR) repeat protein